MSRDKLNRLFVQGVVGFTRYSLYPWLLVHLRSRQYESWGQTVIAYGLLLSVLHVGIYGGLLMASSSSMHRHSSKFFTSFLFFLLTSCYSALAFLSRFVFLALCCFGIGFTSSVLSKSMSLTMTSSTSSTSHQSTARLAEGSLDDESDVMVRQFLIVFSFSTLLSGFLYDERPHVENPLYLLSMTMTLVCVLFTAIRLLRRRKRQLASSLFAKRISSQSASSTGGRGGHSHGQLSSADEQKGYTKIAHFEDKGDLPVKDYQGDVPMNFLSCCRGDLAKARVMYSKCLAWREAYDLESIFDLPQPSFSAITQYYPHAIHGYSLDGCAVVYEILGKGDPTGLRQSAVTIDDLVWHFNLRNELVFRRLATESKIQEVVSASSANGHEGAIRATPYASPYCTATSAGVQGNGYVPRVMVVIDVEGISISSVTTDVLSFIKKNGEIIDNYYPEQVARLVVCKAPRWFSTIWTVIARALPEAVQKKVDILYDAKGLDKYIHPSQRPKDYGGTEEISLIESDGHKLFLALQEEWKKNYGVAPATPSVVDVPETKTGKTDPEKKSVLATTSKGVFNWITSKFNKPQSAFLGEKNSYRFNAQTGKWELEHNARPQKGSLHRVPSEANAATAQSSSRKKLSIDLPSSRSRSSDENEDEDDQLLAEDDEEAFELSPRTNRNGIESSPRRRAQGNKSPSRMTQEQLEEHGLVLAIHAAHYAASSSGGGAANAGNVAKSMSSMNLANMESGSMTDMSGSQSMSMIQGGSYMSTSSQRDSFSSSTASLPSSGSPQTTTKLSATLFLLSGAIFLLVSSICGLLTTLIPVWLSAPLRAGGLGYSARDLGLSMSGAALCALIVLVLMGDRVKHVLNASPIRALRLSCGLLLIGLCLLSFSTRRLSQPIEDILHHHIPHLHNEDIAAASEQERDARKIVILYLSYLLPSQSLWALIWMSFLLCMTLAACTLARRSAAQLLHLMLASSFSAPTSIRFAVQSLGDITSPFLCCLVNALIHNTRLRYPLNASFFFWLSALLTVSVYMLSLFILVQFRGDFGVVSDYQELRALRWQDRRDQQMKLQLQSKWDGSGSGSGAASGLSSSSADFVPPSPAASPHMGLHQRGNFNFSSTTTTGGGGEGGQQEMLSLSSSPSSSSLSSASVTSLEWLQSYEDSVLAVPIGDFALLCSSMGYGYGSKLHNLKTDFKEV